MNLRPYLPVPIASFYAGLKMAIIGCLLDLIGLPLLLWWNGRTVQWLPIVILALAFAAVLFVLAAGLDNTSRYMPQFGLVGRGIISGLCAVALGSLPWLLSPLLTLLIVLGAQFGLLIGWFSVAPVMAELMHRRTTKRLTPSGS